MDWQTLPPLTALRAFAALAETSSTTEAGVRLNVSHAAISQQVRQLEAHMGVVLVDRSGRQTRLTAQGRDLADALTLGFGAIARAVEALSGADAARPLQISTTPSFAAHWLMPCRNSLRQGISQCAAKLGVVDICNGRAASAPDSASTARAMAPNPRVSASARSRPCAVSRVWRPERSTSTTPICASSCRTCWLMAAWLTLSRTPASVVLPVSASAAKARNAVRGGRVCQSMV